MTKTQNGGRKMSNILHTLDGAERSDDFVGTLEHMLSAGEIVPAQVASRSYWSPEKALAGAVLTAALIEVRDHFRNSRHRLAVTEELEWLRSDENDRLFSFLRICEVLDVDAEWVRNVVDGWCAQPRARRAGNWRRAA
jgi:hypothetical protein